jgi:hypothetical protein
MRRPANTILGHPNGEIVTERFLSAGVIAHRRDSAGAWAQCVPKHKCAEKVCTHKLTAWYQYSAGVAAKRGAIPCTNSQCFGGAR